MFGFKFKYGAKLIKIIKILFQKYPSPSWRERCGLMLRGSLVPQTTFHTRNYSNKSYCKDFQLERAETRTSIWVFDIIKQQSYNDCGK